MYRSSRKCLTFVRFALLPKLATSFHGGFTAKFMQIVVAHDFAAYKLILEVGATQSKDR